MSTAGSAAKLKRGVGNPLIDPSGVEVGSIDVSCKFEHEGKESEGAVSLAQPKLESLVKPDEVVVRDGKVRCLFRYPLSKPFVATLRAPDGAGNFTRTALVQAICVEYARIYTEEEAKSTVPVDITSPTNLKRNKTNGPYGIWGHGLGDLHLSNIFYVDEHDALVLGIDS
ncbi:hypothetical protein T492DRAFT_932269 [Pavlovales sp. CCMP2436]|nr:hypothetical protein T492DRAFT_932269 [Pavlovales sp. CCMP2436]